jgi:acetylglutamate kinase
MRKAVRAWWCGSGIRRNDPSALWALIAGQIVTTGHIPHGDSAAAPVENALPRCGIAASRHVRMLLLE